LPLVLIVLLLLLRAHQHGLDLEGVGAWRRLAQQGGAEGRSCKRRDVHDRR
jgi:hypothetical protein